VEHSEHPEHLVHVHFLAQFFVLLAHQGLHNGVVHSKHPEQPVHMHFFSQFFALLTHQVLQIGSGSVPVIVGVDVLDVMVNVGI